MPLSIKLRITKNEKHDPEKETQSEVVASFSKSLTAMDYSEDKDNALLYKIDVEPTGKFSKKAEPEELAAFTGQEKINHEILADWIDVYQAKNFPKVLEKSNHRPVKCFINDDRKKGFTIFKDLGWNPIKVHLKPGGLVDVQEKYTKEEVLEEFLWTNSDTSTESIEELLLKKLGDRTITSTLKKSKLGGHRLAELLSKTKSEITTEFNDVEASTFNLGNMEYSEIDEGSGWEVWKDVKSMSSLLNIRQIPKVNDVLEQTIKVVAVKSFLKARIYYKATLTGEVSTDHTESGLDGKRYWNFPLHYLLKYNDLPKAAVVYEDVELQFYSDFEIITTEKQKEVIKRRRKSKMEKASKSKSRKKTDKSSKRSSVSGNLDVSRVTELTMTPIPEKPEFSKLASPEVSARKKLPKSAAFESMMGVWVSRESKCTAYKTKLETLGEATIASRIAPTIDDMIKKYLAKTKGKEVELKKAPPAKLKNTWAEKLMDVDKEFKNPVFEKSEESTTLIRKTVGENFVFKDLPTGIGPIVDAFERKVFKKGETIAKQGDTEKSYSIVEHGKVIFENNGKEVGSASSGDSFGEVALLYSNTIPVSAKAEGEETVLLQLDQSVFRRIAINEVMRVEEEKIELLKAVPKLKDLDQEELRQLAHALVSVPFKKDDNLTQVFKNRAFCLVDAPSIDVTYPPPAPGKKKSKKKVTALKDGLAFTIDHEAFAKVFGNYNRASFKKTDKEILAEVKTRKENDKKVLSRVKSIQDADFSELEINELMKLISDKKFGVDEEIYSIGTTIKPAIYLVRTGKVFITNQRGGEEIIEPGGYFGHENLNFDWKLSANELPNSAIATLSATAEEETVCGVLTLEEIASIVGRLPTMPDLMDEDVLTKIPLENLIRHRILGEGQFGTVWLVSDKNADTPDPMALKDQSLNDSNHPCAIDSIKDEIDIMKSLRYSSIVQLIDWYEQADMISMLLTLAPGGDLFDIIHQETEDGWISGIKEDLAKFYAAGIADAIAYMHRQKFVFRDLKPENVLIDKEGYPVITDFGFTKKIENGKTFTYCGTPNYVAPEIILNRGHGFSVDNWSLGVLIYEMIEGENPFWDEGMDTEALYDVIVNAPPYPLHERKFTPEVHDLVAGLLEKNPGLRLGSFREKDILEHSWFSSLDMDMLRTRKVEAFWIPDPVEF